jgi:hypothetical protein
MADEIIKQDANKVPVMAGVTNDENQNIIQLRINPNNKRLLVDTPVMSGIGTDETFTLVSANTAYAVPTTPPTQPYTLIIYNASDTDIFFRFTSGTTAGVKITPESSISVDLGANQQVYVYCGTAGKTINLSYKII